MDKRFNKLASSSSSSSSPSSSKKSDYVFAKPQTPKKLSNNNNNNKENEKKEKEKEYLPELYVDLSADYSILPLTTKNKNIKSNDNNTKKSINNNNNNKKVVPATPAPSPARRSARTKTDKMEEPKKPSLYLQYQSIIKEGKIEKEDKPKSLYKQYQAIVQTSMNWKKWKKMKEERDNDVMYRS